MKKIVYLVFLFLLFFRLANAQISIESEKDRYTFYTGEKNVITIKLKNMGEREDSLSLRIYPQSFYGVAISLDTYYLVLNPKEEKEVKIYFYVPVFLDERIVENLPYSFTFSALSLTTGEKYEKKLSITFKSLILAKIKELEINKREILPGEKLIITANILNYKKSEENYLLKLFIKKGRTIYFEDKKIITLTPYSSYRYLKELQISNLEPPGMYNVTLYLYHDSKLIDSNSTFFKIPSIKKVEKIKDVKHGIMSVNVKIKVINVGNDVVNYTLVEKYPGIALAFMKFKIPPIIEEDVLTKIKWSFSLKPNESKEIEYEIVVWPYVLAFSIGGVLAIFALGFYFTPFIKKSKRIEENRIKIAIAVKNTSRKPIKDVVVKDFVPAIYKIEKRFETAKPLIRKVKDGYELIWRIEKMMPGEERIFSYTLISPVEIIGRPKLTKAKMRFTDAYKKRKSARSSIIYKFFD